MFVLPAPQFLANPFARAWNPPPSPDSVASESKGDRSIQQLAFGYATRFLSVSLLTLKNVMDWMARDDDLVGCSALLIQNQKATLLDGK